MQEPEWKGRTPDLNTIREGGMRSALRDAFRTIGFCIGPDA
jgi:hypothetical protein